MKVTMEERFQKKMTKLAKKNTVCRICIFPVHKLGRGFFRLLSYFVNNGKRLAMVGITMMLFVVYSSFSFPMFVTSAEDFGLKEVSGDALGIGLAEETEINMGEIALLGEQGISDVWDNEESNTYIAAVLEETGYLQNRKDIEKSGENPSDTPYGEGISPEGTEMQGGNKPAFDDKAWNLMLVNKQNFIPDDYEFPMGCINTDGGAMYCDERVIEPLLSMFDAALADGVTLRIQSPYRDKKYQKLLFDRKVKLYMDKGLAYLEAFQIASTIVTIPGASEHQTGMAFDLLSNRYDSLDYGFGDTEAGKWLAKHCHEYGFILRYPAGKQYITDIIYEPWHFRYVGVEAATIIMGEEITLEEFWEEYL